MVLEESTGVEGTVLVRLLRLLVGRHQCRKLPLVVLEAAGNNKPVGIVEYRVNDL